MNGFVLALHALVGIVAFGLLAIPGFFFRQIARGGDVKVIRATFAYAVARGKIGGPIALLTALVGFWAAYQLGIPLNSQWLVVSYVIFVLIFALGVGVHARWEAKVYNLALQSPDMQASPELTAVIANPLDSQLQLVSIALWLALFYMMIVRPSW